MTEPKTILCVCCPRGCEIVCCQENGETHTEGAGCARGKAYAGQELAEPMRTFSTSVRVDGGSEPLVSVRLTAPIPLRKIPDACRSLASLHAAAPVRAGDVLVRNIAGEHSDVIATRSVSAETSAP